MIAYSLEGAPPGREAEEVAIRAFSYIAWNQTERDNFVQATGLTGETIRKAARTPQFLAGILDYVVADPCLARAVANSLRISEAGIHEARRQLLPKRTVSQTTAADEFGPGPLNLFCEHCRKLKALDRRRWPHVPARVATVQVPRCGPCGGSLDAIEMWRDAEGREVRLEA